MYSMKITTDKTFGGQCVVIENGGTGHGIYSRRTHKNTATIAYVGFVLVCLNSRDCNRDRTYFL